MSPVSAEGCNQNSIRRYSRNLVVFLGFLTLITLGCGFEAMRLRGLQEEAAQNREEALQLSDQLALGSDRLTAAVRGYAATGNRVYLDEFQRELEQDRNREVAVERLTKLGLSATEKELLERAKSNSDKLVGLENECIALAGAGHLDRAVPLVFGDQYREAKASILEPIGRFRQSLSERFGQQSDLLSQQARNWAEGGLGLLVLNAIACKAFSGRRRVT